MIKSINIRNFKSISSLEIKCNKNFNVIIGENNIGKTTIFEAIHLWKVCYDANLTKKKKAFYANTQNIPFKDMEFLRISEDMDLFNFGCKPQDAELSIGLSLEYDSELFELGFIISKVQKISNAYFQVKYENQDEFFRFSDKLISKGYNLSNGLVISESRPIANIIAKEPYMYTNQVLEKLSKGKGYEVLRNKITKSPSHTLKIEEHLRNVMGTEYKFAEIDKENRTYIRLSVNGTDILSQGSGFLQIAEIFSSWEYSRAGIYILLIDEPDSHLHMKIQKKLIEEFRAIQNSQLFIITHNDKFLSEVNDNEILFVDSIRKEKGRIEPLEYGCKNLVLENLNGVVESIAKLKYAKKIVLLEGQTDRNFFDKMLVIYTTYTGKELPNAYIDIMDGIDTLNKKILTYSRAFTDLVLSDAEWIILRDTDCVPISRQNEVRNSNLAYIRAVNKSLIFQNGYGIESSFIAEIDKFSALLLKYYGLSTTEIGQVKHIVQEMNANYNAKIKSYMDPVNKELESHFLRQKEFRDEKIYQKLQFRDMLAEINQNNIQYIMTKQILNMYLKDIHRKIIHLYEVSNIELTDESIMEFYYNSISCYDEIFESHVNILEKLY